MSIFTRDLEFEMDGFTVLIELSMIPFADKFESWKVTQVWDEFSNEIPEEEWPLVTDTEVFAAIDEAWSE